MYRLQLNWSINQRTLFKYQTENKAKRPLHVTHILYDADVLREGFQQCASWCSYDAASKFKRHYRFES